MKKRFKVKQMEQSKHQAPAEPQEELPGKTGLLDDAPIVADLKIAVEGVKDGYEAWDMTEPVRGDQPIEIIDQAKPAYDGPPRTLAELHAQILAKRANPPPAYVPPAPTARQSEQTRLEMEAGAKAIGKHALQQAGRIIPPHDPREGNSGVPVQRTGEEQEYPNIRGHNQSKEMGSRAV